MNYIILLFLIVVIVLAILAIYFLQIFGPSPIGVYHCICDVPEYGKKEALITVQIVGENWGAKVLHPVNITLNIFGYSVPCECRTV